jgi:exonuclease 3'-5' domain-containing protein 1
MTDDLLSYDLVDTVDGIKTTLRHILDARRDHEDTKLDPHTPLLFVDAEGNNLSRLGTVSLVQIHIPQSGQTFIIDVFVLGAAAFKTTVPCLSYDLSSTSPTAPLPFLGISEGDGISLKSILESPGIIKCFFDVRNDADALFNLYAVSINGVTDLQILENATRKGRRRFLNGLAKTIQDDGSLEPEVLERWLAVKAKGKAMFHKADTLVGATGSKGGRIPTFSRSAQKKEGQNYAIFDTRPLPEDILQYAINVSCCSTLLAPLPIHFFFFSL